MMWHFFKHVLDVFSMEW